MTNRKRRNLITAACVLTLLPLLLAGTCDGLGDFFGGGSEDNAADQGSGEIAVDFRCRIQNDGQVLSCSDSTTGGVKPYRYQWTTDFLSDGGDAWRQDTVIFNYADVCRDEPAGQTLLVTTSLLVVDSSGRDDRDANAFEMCG